MSGPSIGLKKRQFTHKRYTPVYNIHYGYYMAYGDTRVDDIAHARIPSG